MVLKKRPEKTSHKENKIIIFGIIMEHLLERYKILWDVVHVCNA